MTALAVFSAAAIFLYTVGAAIVVVALLAGCDNRDFGYCVYHDSPNPDHLPICKNADGSVRLSPKEEVAQAVARQAEINQCIQSGGKWNTSFGYGVCDKATPAATAAAQEEYADTRDKIIASIRDSEVGSEMIMPKGWQAPLPEGQQWVLKSYNRDGSATFKRVE